MLKKIIISLRINRVEKNEKIYYLFFHYPDSCMLPDRSSLSEEGLVGYTDPSKLRGISFAFTQEGNFQA